MGCRWGCVRSSSGRAPPSRARLSSSGISTRRACRSRTRRASAGSRTCASPRRLSLIRHGASTSAIARATSMSCSSRRTSSARTFSFAVVSTGGAMTAPRRSTQPWIRCLAKASTGSRCVTTTAGRARRISPSSIIASRYHRLQVLPPLAKRKRYPALALTVICADEQGTPENRQPIHWRLITDLPITGVDEAIEKIGWYALRWKIELFHKILKSGCRAEEAKLRSAERLVNLLALFCILAWRVFWLTMLTRTAPQASPRLVFTPLEIRLLDQLVKAKTSSPALTLAHYLTKIARLGGYLARAKDPPPGNMVMWRGLSRLTDIELGASLGMRLVGN